MWALLAVISFRAAILSQVVCTESADLPTREERMAVAWCVLNRVDSEQFPDTVWEVVNQPGQFSLYSLENEIDPDIYRECWYVAAGHITGSERSLPEEYVFYQGDGKHNYFRKEYNSTERYIGGKDVY